MSKFCLNCGAAVASDTSKFCLECGAPLRNEPQPQPQVQQQPQQPLKKQGPTVHYSSQSQFKQDAVQPVRQSPVQQPQSQPQQWQPPIDGNQMTPEQKSMFYPAQTQIESQMPAPVETAAFQQPPAQQPSVQQSSVQQPPLQQEPVQEMSAQFPPPQTMQPLDRCPDMNGQAPAGVYIPEEEFQRLSQMPYSAQGEQISQQQQMPPDFVPPVQQMPDRPNIPQGGQSQSQQFSPNPQQQPQAMPQLQPQQQAPQQQSQPQQQQPNLAEAASKAVNAVTTMASNAPGEMIVGEFDSSIFGTAASTAGMVYGAAQQAAQHIPQQQQPPQNPQNGNPQYPQR